MTPMRVPPMKNPTIADPIVGNPSANMLPDVIAQLITSLTGEREWPIVCCT
ncbi:MAG: hypothetical protein K9L32_08535 [Chromatiaceae bacterium]|nr:hypothetical protein [Chromatiaceae bacterium]